MPRTLPQIAKKLSQPRAMPYADRSTCESESSDLEDLVRKILELVTARSDHAAEFTEGSETVFEIDIDCVRYTLISSKPKPAFHLSSREKEIVRLVAEGLPNKCIGEILEISSWTVATHLRRIFAKINVNSRAAMIGRLLKDRLLIDQTDQSRSQNGAR